MKKLDIIYEDKSIIAINKKSGIPTIAIKKGDYNNLYHEVREYVKKKNPHNKIFIVHRLDKDTSGIVLFAKDEFSKQALQNNWASFKREYVSIVEGIPKKKSDRLVNYLKESKTLQVYVTNDSRAKKAITNYEVVKSNNNYSLLNIWIETGRKNQIRAQLSYIDSPIVGDKKYNAKTKQARLFLHHSKLVINHPVTKKEIVLESSVPKEFSKLI